MSAAVETRSDPASLLLREDQDGIAIVTLNRPAARNSLSLAMLEAMSATLSMIAEDRTVRVVILTSSGPAFSGGHDLKELTAHRGDPDGGRAFFTTCFEACSRMMQQVVNLPQPVIAAVEGIATAAGCQLAASCDLAVASETAKFGVSGIHAGLFCTTPGVALGRAVPRKMAMELLLTGDIVPAAEAQRMGLVNRVVASGQALVEAMAIARRIAGHSALSVRMGKRGFNAQIGLPLDQAYAVASEVMVENLMARDAIEGIDAFIGKRKPVWEDR